MAETSMSGVPEELQRLVLDLIHFERRGEAMAELSKNREKYPVLPQLLWFSCGTIPSLLQEIISVYPSLSPPALTDEASNRVCNALALLQCVASDPETKTLFLNAHIPLYLYPFLNSVNKSKPFEYLRLTSLGVIGALVKQDDSEVVGFLIKTEIVPLCLRIMENGSELSRTVATFIMQKIMQDDRGLHFVCASMDRFHFVSNVLQSMVASLAESPSQRLLKHVVRCYMRLADHPAARKELKRALPDQLRKGPLFDELVRDPSTAKWITELLTLVNQDE